MTMQELNADIKNRAFKRAYLLYGEEDYLKLQFEKKLREAVLNGGADMNEAVLVEKEANLDSINRNVETYPFLADYRLVVVRNSGLFSAGKKKKDAGDGKVADSKAAEEEKDGGKKKKSVKGAPKDKDLADILKSLPDYAVVIFNESDVDSRLRPFKAVVSLGGDIQMKRQTEAVLKKWVVSKAKEMEREISLESADYLVSFVGNDMALLENELSKLAAYTEDKEHIITNETIELLCTKQLQDKVFEMIDAIAERNVSLCMKDYNDLLMLDTEPLKILALIQMQYNRLYAVRLMVDQGKKNEVITSKTGIKPFLISKYRSAAASYSAEQLLVAKRACLEMNEKIITGNIDRQAGLEILVAKLLNL